MPFKLSSPAFSSGARIPRKYTLDGENLSPPLEWHGAPAGTKSFALIMEDPDAPAGTFHHWALYNVAADRDRLPEGLGDDGGERSFGEGLNDFGHARYDGPQPPRGHGPHHYHFKLLALDVDSLPAKSKARVADIARTARAHTLSEAELVGVYER